MESLQSRLRDKAMSKIMTLSVEIRDLKTDLKYLIEDNMEFSLAQTRLAGARRELELWDYVADLVEKDI
jgi:regulator of replication initiation timing